MKRHDGRFSSLAWMRGVPALLVLLALQTISPAAVGDEERFPEQPIPLVRPVPKHFHLEVAQEGLHLLRRLEGPVAPVIVIGPYRSGKSFLLNQLLGVSCDKGFGVGHTRDTQTKGIWLWGHPEAKLHANPQEQLSVLFVDTEGFESTGRSNAYDDRIFALSTILSSVLIYNLPETIRESDVAKLSFAVDLAQGFYDKLKGSEGLPIEPSSMVWLLQRDFLQGKTVQQLVDQAMAMVPNPEHDKEVDQLNRIRQSLSSIAKNSTGYSLTQPHLERTRLCELNDSQLDQGYVRQRDNFRHLVLDMAQVKNVGGRQMTGPLMAELLVSMVEALNAKEIPNVASIVDSFNQQLIQKSLEVYTQQLAGLELPVLEEVFHEADQRARQAAVRHFEAQLLGRWQSQALDEQLRKAMAREGEIKATANVARSNMVCQELEMACEELLEQMLQQRVPSSTKFEGSWAACHARFASHCIGPALSKSEARLSRAWGQAEAQFMRDYNDRLLSCLLVTSVVSVLVFRFVVRVQLLEFAAWASFLFLEVYPKVYAGPGNMYDAPWWRLTAKVWEVVVFVLFGYDFALLLWAVALGAGWALWRWRSRRLLRVKQQRAGAGVRDLDV